MSEKYQYSSNGTTSPSFVTNEKKTIKRFSSATKLSSLRGVNPTGKFNSELTRTGFLGEAKMRAKRIAQNPKRFLEMYADAKGELEFSPTEIPELESFVAQLSAANESIGKKVDQMTERGRVAKERTFLLNLGAASKIKIDEELQHGEEVERGIESYLNEIHRADTCDIERWLLEYNSMSELDLPSGIPSALKTMENLLGSDSKLPKEIHDFIESSLDHFMILDGEFFTKIEEINKELFDIFKIIHSGDWSERESGILYYVLNSFENNFKFSTILSELLSRLFPKKSKQEVLRHKFRLRQKCILEEKRAAVISSWAKNKNDLSSRVIFAWGAVSSRREAELKNQKCLREQREICEFWGERLEKLRKEKCGIVKRIKVLADEVEERRQKAAKTIVETDLVRREALKKDILKYKDSKKTEEEERERVRREEENFEKEQERIRSGLNKTRVAYRKEQLFAKEKKRQEMAAVAEKKKLMLEKSLEKIKEKVEIDYDPANVISDTQATLVRRFETIREQKAAEDESMIKLFKKIYSFSSEVLLRDRRVKLESKLKEAGLLHTTYARQVLLAMEPKPKAHLLSQIKFETND